jgi:hypothetical protein
MLHGASTIIREEGLRAVFKGLTPAFLRQATYGTMRIGFYDVFKDALSTAGPQTASGTQTLPSETNFGTKIVAALSSGALASAIASPTDLVRLRLQNQGPGEVRYRGLVHCLRTVAREEGLMALYRGVRQTVQRAAAVNAAELVSYDVFKARANTLGAKHGLDDSSPAVHLFCGATSGVVGALVTAPLDLVKTRVMCQDTRPSSAARGSPSTAAAVTDTVGAPYRGSLDCARQIVRAEGIAALWKGFLPYCMRNVPWTVSFFLAYEELKRLAGYLQV